MGVWKFCCVLPIGMGRKAHSTRHFMFQITGAGLGEGAGGVHPPPELGVGQGGTLTNFLSNIMQIALSQHRKQLIT